MLLPVDSRGLTLWQLLRVLPPLTATPDIGALASLTPAPLRQPKIAAPAGAEQHPNMRTPEPQSWAERPAPEPSGSWGGRVDERGLLVPRVLLRVTQREPDEAGLNNHAV